MQNLTKILIQTSIAIILSYQLSQAQPNSSVALSLNDTRFSIGDTLILRLRARRKNAEKVRPFLSLHIPGKKIFYYLPNANFTATRPDMPAIEIPDIPATEIFRIKFSGDTILPGTSVHLPDGRYLWVLELLSPDSDTLIDASIASFSLDLGPSIQVFANGTKFDDGDHAKLGIGLHRGNQMVDAEVKAELSIGVGSISVFFKPDLSLTSSPTLIGPFPVIDAYIDNFFSFTVLDSFPRGIYTLKGKLFTESDDLIDESAWSFSIGNGTISGEIITAPKDDMSDYEVKLFSLEGRELAKAIADERGRFILSGIPFDDDSYILVAQSGNTILKKILPRFSESMGEETINSSSTVIAKLVEWEIEKFSSSSAPLSLGIQQLDQERMDIVDKDFPEPGFSVDVKTLVNFLNNTLRDGSSLLSRLVGAGQRVIGAQVELGGNNTTDEILERLLDPDFDGRIIIQQSSIDTGINSQEVRRILSLVEAVDEAIISTNLAHLLPDAFSISAKASTEILNAVGYVDDADSQAVEALIKATDLLKSSIKSRIFAVASANAERASQHMLISSSIIAQATASAISKEDKKIIEAISSLADACEEVAKAVGKAAASKNPKAVEISSDMAEHAELLSTDFLNSVDSGKGISLEIGEGIARVMEELSSGLNTAMDRGGELAVLDPLSKTPEAIRVLREKASAGAKISLAWMNEIIDVAKEINDAIDEGDADRVANAVDNLTATVQNTLQPSTTSTTTTTTTIPPAGGGGGVVVTTTTTTIPDDDVSPYLKSLALVSDIQNPGIRIEFSEPVRLVDAGKVSITSLRDPSPADSPLNPGPLNPNYPDQGSDLGNFESILDEINFCLPMDKTIIAIGDPPRVISVSEIRISPCEDEQHQLRYKVANLSLGDWGLQVATGSSPSDSDYVKPTEANDRRDTIWNIKVGLSETRDFLENSVYIPLLIRIKGEAFQEIDELKNEKVSVDINVMLRLITLPNMETRSATDFRAIFKQIKLDETAITIAFDDDVNTANAQIDPNLPLVSNGKILKISKPQQSPVNLSVVLPRFFDLSTPGKPFGEMDLFIKITFR